MPASEHFSDRICSDSFEESGQGCAARALAGQVLHTVTGSVRLKLHTIFYFNIFKYESSSSIFNNYLKTHTIWGFLGHVCKCVLCSGNSEFAE